MPTIDGRPACVPKDVRVYAVGDIHGRLDLLQAMIRKIEAHDESAPDARSLLIFVGDYIDRGPDSRGVIDCLIREVPSRFEPIFLRGNHEDMMLQSFRNLEIFDVWAMNGGGATAESYGVVFDPGNYTRADARRVTEELSDALPEDHLRFLEGLRLSFAIGDYFFVHAGVRPGVPLQDQDERDCLYIRQRFLTHQGQFGKVIVHGHTPVRSPELLPNRIGIDTGAFFTGRLTAVCLENNRQSFLSCTLD